MSKDQKKREGLAKLQHWHTKEDWEGQGIHSSRSRHSWSTATEQKNSTRVTAQQVGVLASKPRYLGFIFRTHVKVEEEIWFHESCPLTSTWVHKRQKYIKNNKINTQSQNMGHSQRSKKWAPLTPGYSQSSSTADGRGVGAVGKWAQSQKLQGKQAGGEAAHHATRRRCANCHPRSCLERAPSAPPAVEAAAGGVQGGARAFHRLFPQAVHKTDAVPSPSLLSLSPLQVRENRDSLSSGDPTSAQEVPKHCQELNTALYPVILYSSDMFLIFTGQSSLEDGNRPLSSPPKDKMWGQERQQNSWTPVHQMMGKTKHSIPTSNDTFSSAYPNHCSGF